MNSCRSFVCTLEQRSIFVAREELRLDGKKLRDIEAAGENTH